MIYLECVIKPMCWCLGAMPYWHADEAYARGARFLAVPPALTEEVDWNQRDAFRAVCLGSTPARRTQGGGQRPEWCGGAQRGVLPRINRG